MTFGQLIRSRRLELGWTQFEIAMRTGGAVKPKEVSTYEAGTVKPRLDKVEILCDVLGIEIPWRSTFMADTGDMRRSLSSVTPHPGHAA